MRNFTPDSEMGPAIYEFIFNLEEEFLYCRINGEEYGKTGYQKAPDPTITCGFLINREMGQAGDT